MLQLFPGNAVVVHPGFADFEQPFRRAISSASACFGSAPNREANTWPIMPLGGLYANWMCTAVPPFWFGWNLMNPAVLTAASGTLRHAINLLSIASVSIASQLTEIPPGPRTVQ